MLFEVGGEAGELFAGLGEIVSAGGKPVGEFGDAVGVGYRAGGNTLDFDGGLVGLRASFADLLVETVTGVNSLSMLDVHLLDCCRLRIYLSGKGGDLLGGGGLLGIELGHAAGKNDAEAGTEFVAKGPVALRLGGLALEGGHLPGDFIEDVVDAREILTCRLEA